MIFKPNKFDFIWLCITIAVGVICWHINNRPKPVQPAKAYDTGEYVNRQRQQEQAIKEYQQIADSALRLASVATQQATTYRELYLKEKSKHEKIRTIPAPKPDSMERNLSAVESLYPN